MTKSKKNKFQLGNLLQGKGKVLIGLGALAIVEEVVRRMWDKWDLGSILEKAMGEGEAEGEEEEDSEKSAPRSLSAKSEKSQSANGKSAPIH